MIVVWRRSFRDILHAIHGRITDYAKSLKLADTFSAFVSAVKHHIAFSTILASGMIQLYCAPDGDLLFSPFRTVLEGDRVVGHICLSLEPLVCSFGMIYDRLLSGYRTT